MTKETLRLADHPPDLGKPWTTTPASSRRLPRRPHSAGSEPALAWSLFSDSDWRPLQHVVVHGLAQHVSRTFQIKEATFCVVAAPAQSGLYPQGHQERTYHDGGGCGTVGGRWRELCPANIPLLVIDTVDADYRSFHLCTSLWNRQSCLADQTAQVIRVVGSPPLTAHPAEKRHAQRAQLAPCPALTVPWLSHARAPIPLRYGSTRTIRIAGAYSTFQHGMAIALGWADWRRDLRNACHGLRNGSLCSHSYMSMSGKGARTAIELYARSVFCLQPPGDVVARGGIVDAISVGCIPVFLHPAQQQLWPLHWKATRASVLIDWTNLANRNATATTIGREKIGREAADKLLHRLLFMPQAEVLRLQRGVAVATRRMHYRTRQQNESVEVALGSPPDAVDVLVKGITQQVYNNKEAMSGKLLWPAIATRLRPPPSA